MKTRVWVAYDPYLFREALTSLLSQIDQVEIVENHSEDIDIAIFRLAETGQLQDFFLHKSLPKVKMVVFSPRGDRGFIRLPGETGWKDFSPFGMDHLVAEIMAGSQKYADYGQIPSKPRTGNLHYIEK